MRSPAYVGPPQNLDQALWDLVRPPGGCAGCWRRCAARAADGGAARGPTRPAWAVLRAVEAVYDAAGVGAVVLCVGRVG